MRRAGRPRGTEILRLGAYSSKSCAALMLPYGEAKSVPGIQNPGKPLASPKRGDRV